MEKEIVIKQNNIEMDNIKIVENHDSSISINQDSDREHEILVFDKSLPELIAALQQFLPKEEGK